MASERVRSDVAGERNIGIGKRLPIMRAIPHRAPRVHCRDFDEHESSRVWRAGAPNGERLPVGAPFGHWQSQTCIAALSSSGLTAPWLPDGAMDRTAFDLEVETQLAPALQLGEVVIPGQSQGPSIGHRGRGTARAWRLVHPT